MRDMLIKWLGGVTRKEHDEFVEMCEAFSSKHLTAAPGGTDGLYLRDLSITGDVIVHRDFSSVKGCHVTGHIRFAPWVRHTHLHPIRIEAVEPC